MSAWKACDLRGRFPGEVSAELFEAIGRGIGSLLQLGARVLVAGDFRTSTPTLKLALAEGLTGAGAHVLDAGQIPTPVAYFAHRYCAADAVLIVTASHNPANHNGLKLTIGSLPPLPEDFERLRESVERRRFRESRGRTESVDPVPAYRRWIVDRWQPAGPERRLRVVLDAGNGAWSELAPAIFEQLGFVVHRLFCEIDGAYPNRPPDSARSANLAELCRQVKSTGADLGVAWDGDGDRVAFVDGVGAAVSADEVAVLAVRDMLRGSRGEKVVFDIKLSDVVRREILGCGGIPVVERSGHAFIKRRMIQESCLLGCEASGHYFFRELYGGDDGLFAALWMARLVACSGPLEVLRRSVPLVFATPDLRLPASLLGYEAATQRLRDLFRGARETTLDGLRWETGDGFVLARQSVTEPVFTLRIEGTTEQAQDRLLTACLRALPEVAAEIERQIQIARSV